MKKKLSLLLCFILLILTGCQASEKTIRFGAADIGGMYYSFANTFTELANEELSSPSIKVRTTAGSSANLRLLSENYIELGIAQSDLIRDAYKENTNLRAIAGLYMEACQLVVRADSKIKTLDDLANCTVSIGAKESGTELNATQILEFSGIPSSIITTKNLDYVKAANALKSGDIDAFFCTAGLTTTIIEELSRECDIRLIPLDKSVIKKMLSYSNAYSSYSIPAGTYKGQNKDIPTIGVKSVLITSDSLSDEVVETLTKLLFEKNKELQYSTSLNLQLDETIATKNIPIPFHSGAIKYYKAHEINVDTK